LEPSSLASPASPAEEPAEADAERALALAQERWPDVVEHVTARKHLLGAMLNSARPLRLEHSTSTLVIGFATDFNRKRAETAANRQAIEAGLRHALGRDWRVVCTLAAPPEGAEPLLEDPVINYAARTFGGQPRRLGGEPAEPF
jgi:hypothetical protein